MTGNRKLREGISGRPEPKLGRMFLLSLGLHVLVFLVFSGVIMPRLGAQRREVYYVDLVNLPVERPQPGRPEARPQPKAKPEPKPEPVKKAPAAKPEPRPSPKPQAKPEKAPLKTAAAKPEPKPKPQPKPARPEPKPAPKPESPPASYDDVQKRLAQMRAKQKREQEMAALKAKIARLAEKDSRAENPVPEAPVGMPEGHGDQAGVERRAWLQAFFKANWSLSKYQVAGRNLQARVEVRYDGNGHLLDYRLLEPSGDQTFDDSVKRAVLREKQLPFEPDRAFEEEIIFNLKDLME